VAVRLRRGGGGGGASRPQAIRRRGVTSARAQPLGAGMRAWERCGAPRRRGGKEREDAERRRKGPKRRVGGANAGRTAYLTL